MVMFYFQERCGMREEERGKRGDQEGHLYDQKGCVMERGKGGCGMEMDWSIIHRG